MIQHYIRSTKTLAMAALVAVGLSPLEASAQSSSSIRYEDMNSFTSDPDALDEEVSQIFGRFFETSFFGGTGIYTGELGSVADAGYLVGMKFNFYFDRMWSTELAAAIGKNNFTYVGTDKELSLLTSVVPLQFGLRYNFDRDTLPRGFSTMNPYLAGGVEVVFRSEAVQGTPNIGEFSDILQAKYGPGAIVNTTAFGVHLGAGTQFDVYRNRLFLGLDLRNHLIFWPDAGTPVTDFGGYGRRGWFISVLGTLSYSY